MSEAFAGDYVDLRFVKSRKVAQIVMEIPIEQATAFVASFGAPDPSTGIPVAIARLQELPSSGRSVAHTDDDKSRHDPTRPGGYSKGDSRERPAPPRRQWSELSRAEQAGIACEDVHFQRFLGRQPYMPGVPPINDSKSARSYVLGWCNIASRAELNTNARAGGDWDKLYSDYQLWKRGAAA